MPTETVYGLAGNAFSEQAVRRIFEVKQRPAYWVRQRMGRGLPDPASQVRERPARGPRTARAERDHTQPSLPL